jgi:predicted protein tyrosine phosphatase
MYLTDAALDRSKDLGVCVASWMHSKQTIERLEAKGVTVIAIVGAADERAELPFEPNDFVTIRRFKDTENTDDPDRAFPNDVNALLDAAAQAPPGVILFCCPGALSRSPALAAAFLMRRDGLTREEAISTVKEIQPGCKPNKLVLDVSIARRMATRMRMV